MMDKLTKTKDPWDNLNEWVGFSLAANLYLTAYIYYKIKIWILFIHVV